MLPKLLALTIGMHFHTGCLRTLFLPYKLVHKHIYIYLITGHSWEDREKTNNPNNHSKLQLFLETIAIGMIITENYILWFLPAARKLDWLNSNFKFVTAFAHLAKWILLNHFGWDIDTLMCRMCGMYVRDIQNVQNVMCRMCEVCKKVSEANYSSLVYISPRFLFHLFGRKSLRVFVAFDLSDF